MLQIKNLNKKYGRNLVLDDISLDIPNSGIFALLGSNGAGKTTLISILCGVIKSNSGEIFYNGKSFFDVLKKDKSLCSLTPQEFAFYSTLSVIENIEFFSNISSLAGKKRKDMVDFALYVSRLESCLNMRAGKLSGGLKRRLNLAISLLNDPKILFLDEPTVGIEPHTRDFILNSIKSLSTSKRLIVYTSHHMQEIDFLADGGAIMDRGKIVTTFEKKDKPALKVSLKYPNRENIDTMNKFAPFTPYKDSFVSEDFDEKKLVEFFIFARKYSIEFKSVSFAPLSIETLFLSLTDKGAA